MPSRYTETKGTIPFQQTKTNTKSERKQTQKAQKSKAGKKKFGAVCVFDTD